MTAVRHISRLELSVRFLVKTYGIREVKDVISRRILERFHEEGIELASATVELVRVPPVEVRTVDARPASDEAPSAHH